MRKTFFRAPSGSQFYFLFILLGFWRIMDGLNLLARPHPDVRTSLLALLVGTMWLGMGAAELVQPHRIKLAGWLRIVALAAALSWVTWYVAGLFVS